MAKNKKQDKVTEFKRRSGVDLPEQPVTENTDFETVPESREGEGDVMETRTAEANIERARKLAEENSAHDQA